MQNRGKYDGQFKILVLGESGVGKTSLLTRYCDDDFSHTHLPTIGIDFKIKNVIIHDKMYKLQIWDTAGQERFRVITKTYYRAASGIILTYDVTDENSFNKIRLWVKQIEENAPKNVCKILVGNKCDSVERKISTEDGQALADTYQIKFFETSAKTKFNVNDVFSSLINEIVETANPEIRNRTNTKKGINIAGEIGKTNSDGKCCK